MLVQIVRRVNGQGDRVCQERSDHVEGSREAWDGMLIESFRDELNTMIVHDDGLRGSKLGRHDVVGALLSVWWDYYEEEGEFQERKERIFWKDQKSKAHNRKARGRSRSSRFFEFGVRCSVVKGTLNLVQEKVYLNGVREYYIPYLTFLSTHPTTTTFIKVHKTSQLLIPKTFDFSFSSFLLLLFTGLREATVRRHAKNVPPNRSLKFQNPHHLTKFGSR